MHKLVRIVLVTGALAFVGSTPAFTQVAFAQSLTAATLPAEVQASLSTITPAQQARLLRNLSSLPPAARASFLAMTPAQIVAVASLSPAVFSQVSRLDSTQRVAVATAVSNVNTAARSGASVADAMAALNTALVNTGNTALRTAVSVGVAANVSEAAAAAPAGAPIRQAAVAVTTAAASTLPAGSPQIATLVAAAAAVEQDATQLDAAIGAINDEVSPT